MRLWKITGRWILKAEVHVQGPGALVICEEYLSRNDRGGAGDPGRTLRAS